MPNKTVDFLSLCGLPLKSSNTFSYTQSILSSLSLFIAMTLRLSRRAAIRMSSALAVTGTLAALGTEILNDEAFGASPQGERLARCQNSPNWRNGAFCNREPTENLRADRAGFLDLARFLLESDQGQKPSQPIPAVKTNLRALAEDTLVWFGHSSFLLRSGGLHILIDPTFHNVFPFAIPGLSTPFAPFPGSNLYSDQDLPNIDWLVITHDHYDHLDEKTVKAIVNRVDHVVMPLGVGAHLERWGYPPRKLVELDWFETQHLSNGP